MLKSAIHFLRQWFLAPHSRTALDILFEHAPAVTSSLPERLKWLREIMQWIRAKGNIKNELFLSSGHTQVTRIKYLLNLIEKNPIWSEKLVNILGSVLDETDAVNLFFSVGLPNQEGFLSELLERLHLKIFPQAPQHQELAFLVKETFSRSEDVAWVNQLDEAIFAQLVSLFKKAKNFDKVKKQLIENIEDALLLLSLQIQAVGLGPLIRERIQNKKFRELALFQLPDQMKALIEEKNPFLRAKIADDVQKLVADIFHSLFDVYTHLDEYGVSISIVYQLDRMEAQLLRVQSLVHLITDPQISLLEIQKTFARLVEDGVRSRSLIALLGDNFSLISRKIAERSAETGEHYITRTREEQRLFFRSAAGGGFLTGFTTALKFMIMALPIFPFLQGWLLALNYSLSFVFIQLAHFTLATKQPSMTATSLAAKMHRVSETQAMQELVDEIIHTLRSQWVAVAGNLLAVIPTIFVIDVIFQFFFGHHILDSKHAIETVHSISLLGPTFLFSIFTGLLLWFSSQVAGWVDNWWAYHRMTSAIKHHPRIQFVLGTDETKKFALFLKKNIGGLAGNTSLGFFLGLLPVLLKFFGLPIEVRHVTLSTGSLTAAVLELGWSSFATASMWLAISGIFAIGILNVGTAFFCSMVVAVRARRVKAPERSLIYTALWAQLKKKPGSLFWAQK